MSNFSYDDFAVLVRKFNPEMLSPESLKSLRIVPLSDAPSMADAIKGTNLEGLDSASNLPREKDGSVVTSNVTVQHGSAGYCRLVGHIEAVKPQEAPVTTAKAFVLYRTVTDSSDNPSKKEVIAVASLKEGFEIGDVCYPSFTITTVNNYQSVAFNPNAFATVEDLKNINGLDGLHIAFDTDSGDLKLLDKDGNVLDQANLPIKADVIIADGEEGYKYVKTDVAQDIHAAKAWMPEGSTAWKPEGAVTYTMKHAALVMGKGSSGDEVLGIASYKEGTKMYYTFDEGAQILNISGTEVPWLASKPFTEDLNHTLKYGLEAFVWTVKESKESKVTKVTPDEPFFSQLNDSLLALGFHEGDDIALGTNLATLAPTEGVSPLNKVDADDYIHGKNKKATREKEVDTQRANANEELKEWNKQHPALAHSAVYGTRISSDGVDIRNGKIEIGNGIENKKEDNVKRYVIETDIDDRVGAREGKGLQIGVIDSVQGDSNVIEPIQKDILTINAEDYISGAPTCLALLKCSKSGDPATVSASLDGGRITANFKASGAETNGVFTLTITDNRANNDFGDAPRIVEIIPVYKSGADDTEAVPAQRSISAIKEPNKEPDGNGKTLSIQCSQVIDWAQSIALGGTENGMELYLIVKVY